MGEWVDEEHPQAPLGVATRRLFIIQKSIKSVNGYGLLLNSRLGFDNSPDQQQGENDYQDHGEDSIFLFILFNPAAAGDHLAL